MNFTLNSILHFFVFIPLVGFLVSLLVKDGKEKTLSHVATATIGIQMLFGIPFVMYWLFSNHPNLNLKDITVYENEEYQFFIDFYFDKSMPINMISSYLASILLIFMIPMILPGFSNGKYYVFIVPYILNVANFYYEKNKLFYFILICNLIILFTMLYQLI